MARARRPERQSTPLDPNVLKRKAATLRSMFPHVSAAAITSVITLSNGDIDAASRRLLADDDHQEPVPATPPSPPDSDQSRVENRDDVLAQSAPPDNEDRSSSDSEPSTTPASLFHLLGVDDDDDGGGDDDADDEGGGSGDSGGGDDGGGNDDADDNDDDDDSADDDDTNSCRRCVNDRIEKSTGARCDQDGMARLKAHAAPQSASEVELLTSELASSGMTEAVKRPDGGGCGSVTATAIEVATTWECSGCTFHNPSSAPACEICGAPRPLPATAPALSKKAAARREAAARKLAAINKKAATIDEQAGGTSSDSEWLDDDEPW
jgi:hypothetical protein